MSVPIALVKFGLVEPEPDIILNIRLCFLSEGEPLVPKVYIFAKEVHTPRVFISLIPLWDLAFSYFWKVLCKMKDVLGG